MSKFASQTTVSAEKSRAEIETTLRKYGCTGFAYGWQGTVALIQFEMSGRRIKFVLPLPDRKAAEFTHTRSRGGWLSPRTELQAQAAWEQACRQRWRALLLCIKAKLEAVDCKITTFENEFMAHICLPNGQTVGDWMSPQIARVYESGSMPPMLGYSPEGDDE